MSVAIQVTRNTLRAIEETSPLDVVIERRPVTVEITAGTPLTNDIAAALNAADEPGVGNPFATLNDVDAARYARIFMMGA